MPKRKTFSIAELVHTVNKRNELSTCERKVREGWNSLLSKVLLDADVYSGYNYLGAEDVPAQELPGIAYQDKHGNSLTATEFFEHMEAEPQVLTDERIFPDTTRRFYYLDSILGDAYSKLEDKYREKVREEAAAAARDIIDRELDLRIVEENTP